MLLHKSIEIDIKSLAEDGTFEGWAARFDSVDLQGDIIDPAAFAGAHGKEFPILDGHKSDVPVGVGTVEVRPEGLWIKAKLLTSIRAGMEAYEKVKGRISRGLSVGFRMLEKVPEGAARRIKLAELVEVSLTPFPAHPGALVTAFKSEPNPYAALLPYL